MAHPCLLWVEVTPPPPSVHCNSEQTLSVIMDTLPLRKAARNNNSRPVDSSNDDGDEDEHDPDLAKVNLLSSLLNQPLDSALFYPVAKCAV